MDVDALIEKLYAAKVPSRSLDQDVAVALGWTEDKEAGVWLDSRGRAASRAPFYTTSLHAISSFAASLSDHGGVSWEDGMGSAKIGDGDAVEANSPELALCIATLIYIKEKPHAESS